MRDTATWAKVKASSDGLKHRCEMFDATSNGLCNATEATETKMLTVVNSSPRIFHLAEEHVQPSSDLCTSLEDLQVQNSLSLVDLS